MVNDRRKKPNRFFSILIGLGIFLIVGFIVFGFICSSRIPRGRIGVVIQGDPTVLVTWESDRSRFALFLLPSSMQIEAIHGYSWYSLDALWKLDTMDKHGGLIYKDSLQEALATPVRWYTVGSGASVNSAQQAIDYVQEQLSVSHILSTIGGRKTNLSLIDLWYLTGQIQRMGADAISFFDFRDGQIASDVTLPDGTTASHFDSAKYDAVVGNMLEDTPIRQEGMRIAIYNTTATPGIGQRVARLLERLGGFVVFVGNDDIPFSGMCEVVADKPILSSLTAQFFRTFYGCTLRESREDHRRADIVVRLGSDMEKRYLPAGH